MIRVENSCQGKTSYESKAKANEAAKHLNQLGGSRMHSYRCKVCHSVHLGHEARQHKLVKNKGKRVNHSHEGGTHKIDSKYFKP